ncbi:MAG TPA: ankyrin repeat domain-containing protein [Verrucomicrobiota bacterium]|nr:ankyrin repeat domain-containing protein [Verrucomicrobiota bacterium]
MNSSRTIASLIGLIVIALTQGTHAAQPSELIAAVKSGDGPTIKTILQVPDPDRINGRDARGNTALHWAALSGNDRIVAQLLEVGFDARATNSAGATPLHYGVGNELVVGLLLKAGANPNARSIAGGTPLHAAAGRPESFAQVKRLVEAGAEVDPVRLPSSPFEPRDTPLSLAAFSGDERTVEFLLDRGAAPGVAGETNSPFSPVAGAALAGRERILKMLVARGGSVNCDDDFAGHALNIASYARHTHLIPYLLEQNIDLHKRASFGEGVPPMVWSAYDETGDPSFARALLERGLDVNEPSSAGSTALSWALRRGETPLVAFLRSRGATEIPTKQKSVPNHPVPIDSRERESAIRSSVQRALQLLQKSSDGFLDNGFVKQIGCVSCHHQTLPAVTFARAQERGFHLDEASLGRQLAAQQTGWSKTRDRAYEMHAPQPAPAAVIGYGLQGLHALRYQPDDLTDAMTWYLAETQMPDGSWADFDFRPPMEEGPIAGTALTIKALQYYPPSVGTQPLKKRIEKARAWLEQCQPTELNQRIFRYHGLGWAGASPSELRRETKELLSLQRPDGGWAPLPTLESDGWTTGHMLVSLHEAGGLAASTPEYQRGVEFLLRTQFDDGSWWIRSRTWPFQPHFDSGFPHGKDQWISAGGTAWAAMALLLTIEPNFSKDVFPSAQQLIASTESKRTRPVDPARAAQAAPASSTSIDFNRDIRPMLERSCAGCHSGEKPKGGFGITTRDLALKGGQSGEPAIIPGHGNGSALLRFVQDQVEDLEMPPLGKRGKFPALTKEETSRLRAWIDQGAVWPAGVILQASGK